VQLKLWSDETGGGSCTRGGESPAVPLESVAAAEEAVVAADERRRPGRELECNYISEGSRESTEKYKLLRLIRVEGTIPQVPPRRPPPPPRVRHHGRTTMTCTRK
jgi:hypothetical protein